MRYALALTFAALLAPPTLRAADPELPPVTFQTHPPERVLNDLRFAADLVGGEKAVKAFNDAIKAKLGEKGFEGLDLSKPVVGYINLKPKPEDTSVVIAFPVTNEKEFLALCDRWNGGEKAKDLVKGIWQLPPLAPRYKARMKFAEGYAYIASGDTEAAALAALDEKALVSPEKIYDPAENAVFVGRVHFDRLTPAFKLALPTYVKNIKQELRLDEIPDRDLGKVIKAGLPEVEKMVARYALLMLGGADTAALRLNVDLATSDLVVEFGVKPKPDTPLAKAVADHKPTGNNFAGLLTPDTVAGFKTRLPFFNDELKAAGVKMLEEGQKMAAQAPGNGKDFLDELFKGFIRTVKTGEADIVGGVRGPNKDGQFTAVGAIAFDDPSALEKEFKKFVEKDAPQDELNRIKWDAAKAGKVSIHTYKVPNERGFLNPAQIFGGDDCTLAFAFAPKGVFIVLGPDAIATMNGALAVKPAEGPMLDVVINPARMKKLVEKGGGNAISAEKALGKDDKLVSALSLNVSGGKELSVRLAINLRLLPRAIVADEIERGGVDQEPLPPVPVEKK
jgi:hypothetical protein